MAGSCQDQIAYSGVRSHTYTFALHPSFAIAYNLTPPFLRYFIFHSFRFPIFAPIPTPCPKPALKPPPAGSRPCAAKPAGLGLVLKGFLSTVATVYLAKIREERKCGSY